MPLPATTFSQMLTTISLVFTAHKWTPHFAIYLTFPIFVMWWFSSVYNGIPNTIGWRFRGDFTEVDFLDESPEFYLQRKDSTGVQPRSALNDLEYLRDKHMGYTKQF